MDSRIVVFILGFNYALVPPKIPKEDIVNGIENTLYKLSDYEKKIIRQESCEILGEAKLPRPNHNETDKIAS